MGNVESSGLGGALEIKPRRMQFPFEKVEGTYFYNNNALITAFMACLSSTFPPGEAEFIASVRQYRDKIKDPVLLDQIKGFIGQEGHHSHQHKRANEIITERGLDANRLERHLDKDIKKFLTYKHATPKFRLAMTVCMEHITAVMAEYALTHPHMTEPMDDRIQELILWHAVEEIEHKSVAFDVYMQTEGDQKYLRRVMAFITVMFSLRISAYMVAILWWARKMPSFKDVKEMTSFLWAKKGMIRRIRKPYMDFFKKGFHPWDHANQHLVEQWLSEHYRPEHDLGAAKQASRKAG